MTINAWNAISVSTRAWVLPAVVGSRDDHGCTDHTNFAPKNSSCFGAHSLESVHQIGSSPLTRAGEPWPDLGVPDRTPRAQAAMAPAIAFHRAYRASSAS